MAAAMVFAGLVAAQPTPARAEEGLLSLQVCNKSGRAATVAASFMEHGSGDWVIRGWFAVESGACTTIGSTDNANFYMYAETLNSGDLTWGGDHDLCVQYPGPFTVHGAGSGRTCTEDEELRGFQPLQAEESGTYTWTLNP